METQILRWYFVIAIIQCSTSDEISITAYVSEYHSRTQLSNASNITVLSKGNILASENFL